MVHEVSTCDQLVYILGQETETCLADNPACASRFCDLSVNLLFYFFSRYSLLLAEHPYAVFFFMLVLIIICGLASFLPQFNAPDFPDFSTPVMVRMIPFFWFAVNFCTKANF